jgi:hypothetical protein
VQSLKSCSYFVYMLRYKFLRLSGHHLGLSTPGFGGGKYPDSSIGLLDDLEIKVKRLKLRFYLVFKLRYKNTRPGELSLFISFILFGEIIITIVLFCLYFISYPRYLESRALKSYIKKC